MTELSVPAKDRYLEQKFEMVPTSPQLTISIENEERASLFKTSEAAGEISTCNAGLCPPAKAPLEGKMECMSVKFEDLRRMSLRTTS